MLIVMACAKGDVAVQGDPFEATAVGAGDNDDVACEIRNSGGHGRIGVDPGPRDLQPLIDDKCANVHERCSRDIYPVAIPGMGNGRINP